ILDSHPETLWELNMSLILFFVRKIGIPVQFRTTEDFTKSEGTVGNGVWEGLPYNPSLDAVDLRSVIHPKRSDDILGRLGKEKPYFQVFAQKYGFIPNLSVMDLLFNEGPDSISYLL
ncbi:MAG: WbqC family protein, partial [Candidatus Cryptobacteroides sp.]